MSDRFTNSCRDELKTVGHTYTSETCPKCKLENEVKKLRTLIKEVYMECYVTGVSNYKSVDDFRHFSVMDGWEESEVKQKVST